ncbi:heparan-alpha-glucosaminide N-acetyltransferase [Leptinotarsa decemlineata]|uniref:heparan-alpha-glucosaminide N-acetyltransferase n=1 Tax=Leptinotarsa decemlineata TaxID=7539 RepID=UPI003D305806
MLFENKNKCLNLNPNLVYDEACVDIVNKVNETLSIFYQYDECHKCDFQNLTLLSPSTNTSVVVKTSSPIQFKYSWKDKTQECWPQLLYEHYRYGWNVTDTCTPVYVKEPADDAYLPILMAFVVLFCFGTMWYMVKCIYKNSSKLRQLISLSTEIETDLGGSSSGTPLVNDRPVARKHPHRIKSIDIFRGFCITLMIFVNYGGGQYWFFKHSVWNGITIADLVFPWFLWLMGLSLTISLQKKFRYLIPKRVMIFTVIRRSFILIAIGLILNSNKNMSTIEDLRFPGVLQRIGLTYLVVGILEIAFTKRTEVDNISWAADIKKSFRQWITVSLLVFIHTCITFLVDVPSCGRGYLGPGGLDEGGKYFNCTGGVAGYIDRAVFGHHMYKHPACQKVYENVVYYDPEGILGTLTSIFTVYLGVQAGITYHTFQNHREKVIRWIVWGFSTGILGGALCNFTRNDGWIPLNKQLWSLSFALVTSGMAFIIQTILFLLVDVLKKWGGRPLFYPGMNAIILYIGHILMMNTFPFGWKPSLITHGTYLFMNLWGTFLWVSIAIFLYKNNMFLTI